MNNKSFRGTKKNEATWKDQAEVDNGKETASFSNQQIKIKKTNESDAERTKAAKKTK